MSKYAIDINLKDDVSLEFYSMIQTLEDTIDSKIPENEVLLCVWVADHSPGTKMYVTTDDLGTVKFAPIEGLTWESLEQEVPEIIPFYEKYPLEKTFVQVRDQNVPPHRHRHSITSCWTMTFINCEAEGDLKFYEPKDPATFNENEQITWDMSLWNVLDELTTKPNSVYAFDTWNWHGWHTEGSKPIITNFCIKGSSSKEAANEIVNRVLAKS